MRGRCSPLHHSTHSPPPHVVPLHANLATAHPLALHGQGAHRARGVARNADVGNGEGAPPRRAVRAARDCARRGHVLGMAERAEQHAGHLRHPRHEHRRLAVSCVFVVQFVLLADAH